MNRAIILLIVLSLMAPSAVLAAKGGSFWSSLKSRIMGITPKKQATVTTAVGGVRGALSDEAEDVYWKGKEINEVDEAELMKFNEALDMAVKGDEANSLKAFESFLDEYPNSSLRSDALDAVSALKSGAGGEAAPDEEAQPQQDMETQSPDKEMEEEATH